MEAIIEQQDVDEACRRVSELLDESVIVDRDEPMKVQETTTSQPEFRIVQRGKTWDLSRIDFDELKKDFKQALIDRYNAGSTSSDRFYDDLIRYTKALKEEAERHIREGLTEDELEVFDLLAKEKMTEAETRQVRLAAKSLLARLKEEAPPVLVQDWYKDSQTQQLVRSAIGEVLDEHLPQTYERGLFAEKRDSIFDLVLDLASHKRKWAA